MLTFLGDIHGDYTVLCELRRRFKLTTPVVQVGDCGFSPTLLRDWPKELGFDTYAIDGNHENHEWLKQFSQDRITEVAERLFYVPRGTVLTLEGVRLGMLGGADSVDRAYRTRGRDWWPEEQVTDEQVRKLWDAEFDVLVTHAVPYSVLPFLVPKLIPQQWGLPADWLDWSAIRVETLWNHKDRMPMVCGHLHVAKRVGGCRVLDINELWVWGT